MKHTIVIVLSILFYSSGCGDNNGPSTEAAIDATGPTHSAEIVRTTHGIPHVTANDWSSLGYGFGYAYSQDNFCVLMRTIVKANGQSARYLGEEGDLNKDLVYALYSNEARLRAAWIDEQPGYIQELMAGYASGVNRYLEETGADGLPGGPLGCRLAPWVRSIDSLDIAKLLHRLVIRSGTAALAEHIVAATPRKIAPAISPPAHPEGLLERKALRRSLGLPAPSQLGSNAYAIGALSSQSNTGLLLGNPHFQWKRGRRFYMAHLRIPGRYDVMGATLEGIPLLAIGFNRELAWTHTISTGQRFTFYELTLNPNNPLQYKYDGNMYEIEPITVQVKQQTSTGDVHTVEHTFYLSQFGPIVQFPESSPLGGWPNAYGTVLAIKDANLDSAGLLHQWAEMGSAASMEEFKTALMQVALPWLNTIAASHSGDAFYGDISVTPHVSAAKQQQCGHTAVAMMLAEFGLVVLDGSTSACQWGSDGSPELFAYDDLPKLDTRDYVANANDSYWLSNPRQRLTGFAPIIGRERVAQSLRTRQTFAQAEKRIAGSDGLGTAGFNIDNLRALMYRNDSIAATLVLDDLVALCASINNWSPAEAAEACTILRRWDGRFDVDSVGAAIFTEWWKRVDTLERLWAVEFDAKDPINTPHTLNSGDPATAKVLKKALVAATKTLLDAGIPLDRPWGELQFSERNGQRIPIHGGHDSLAFSVINAELVAGQGYSNISYGNSYIQAVTWNDTECPDAFGILTYSQSAHSASPFFADQTELYASKGWVDLPYCGEDVDRAQISRTMLTTHNRAASPPR
ncbi:MAG: penicillin acylase family protein [Proteobacteria bacterium]|nr:penicillin acylase family protein [Pseudomonadota bacterium]